MEFSELINTRQSVRKYDDRPVEKEKLDMLVESIRLAPSASNSQPWKVILVDHPELKDQVARSTFSSVVSFNKFAVQAPLLAVLAIEKPKVITQVGARIKRIDFPLIDIGIAAEHFCLQAAELELGTCMLGWFNEREIKQLLNIPRGVRVGLVITLGYPAADYPLRAKSRKKTEEMSSRNGY